MGDGAGQDDSSEEEGEEEECSRKESKLPSGAAASKKKYPPPHTDPPPWKLPSGADSTVREGLRGFRTANVNDKGGVLLESLMPHRWLPAARVDVEEEEEERGLIKDLVGGNLSKVLSRWTHGVRR